MIAKLIDKINAEQIEKAKKQVPIRVGDVVKVFVRIKEGEKERRQAFNGTVIAMDGGKGLSATFTVRRFALGIGVEKVFPLYSPYIDHIELVNHSRVRRAKLYYLRKLTGKKARLRTIPLTDEEQAAKTAAMKSAKSEKAEK